MMRKLVSLVLAGCLLSACTPEGFIAFNQAILDTAEKNGIDLTIESEATFSQSTKTNVFGKETEDTQVEKVVFKGSVKKENVTEVQEEVVEETTEIEETQKVEEAEEEVKTTTQEAENVTLQKVGTKAK